MHRFEEPVARVGDDSAMPLNRCRPTAGANRKESSRWPVF